MNRPMKPFDTYPEDRAQLLKLAHILENPDDHDEDVYRSAAITMGDLVRAILTDEEAAIQMRIDEEVSAPSSA